ncbi:MAG TPA: CocE/NonD family hydrolase, partial [Solirubrobacteraceae bacterium]|nr:CocE/NonD family hydrolase [Solirubrobacteraceae bacterium]
MRRVLPLATVVACLVWGAASARAGDATLLGLTGCGATSGLYQCAGLAPSWDGVPLDTTVTLPRRLVRHAPLVVELNGFGNSKYEYLDPSSHAYTGNAYEWARRGYVVLTYTARGFWGSCGTPA